MEPKYSHSNGFEHHQCESYRDGDWIIYTCSQCNYELKEHWETGEISVTNAHPHIRHSGSYFPPSYKMALENRN